MQFANLLGGVAAVCTTGAFIPQIIKIRRQGGEDLSYSMLSFYWIGVLLWLIYGLLFHLSAVILANSAACLLVSCAAVLKFRYAQPSRTGAKRKLRIAVDMDEVIADTLEHHLSVFNSTTGRDVTAEDIREKGLSVALGHENQELFDSLPHQPGFFSDLPVMAGSQCALETLSSKHEVFITSAAMEVPFSFDDKFRWLRRHFPFIAPERIVFCGDKTIVDADYMIDDNSRHFRYFRGTGILFAAPHNESEETRNRVRNWEEVVSRLR